MTLDYVITNYTGETDLQVWQEIVSRRPVNCSLVPLRVTQNAPVDGWSPARPTESRLTITGQVWQGSGGTLYQGPRDQVGHGIRDPATRQDMVSGTQGPVH